MATTPAARTDAEAAPLADSDLSLDFLRVTERAAIACAMTMGQGDRHKSDQVAVEAMRAECPDDVVALMTACQVLRLASMAAASLRWARTRVALNCDS